VNGEAVLDLIYFDAGSGHRTAAEALRDVIAQERRPWTVRLVNLQEVLDSIDVFARITGMRLQDIYNLLLRRGWTLGSPYMLRALQAVVRAYHAPAVRLLREFWRRREPAPDAVVSLIPNFNRALKESLGAVPFVTILTDLADCPPHFWIERQEQYLVCGSPRACEQARAMGHPPGRIFPVSGMLVRPEFYAAGGADRGAERARLGLDPFTTTALVLFGGCGSRDIEEIAERLEEVTVPLQLVLLCGQDARLAARLAGRASRLRRHVAGFTRDVPRYMRAADFVIGKPGPGLISEALVMGLPLIVERNARTLPQERYNADWIAANGLGLVLRRLRDVADAVAELTAADHLARFRARAAQHRPRAIAEVPDVLATILARSCARPAACEGAL
jgi:1,2-diacylglycerol 3-beta-galactosyltransferase